MNTNKYKYLKLFFLTFLSFFLFNNIALADDVIDCESLKTETACSTYGKCAWKPETGKCYEEFIAKSPCSDKSIRTIVRFFGVILMFAKLAVPIIIIIFGTIDFYKAMIDKDEKLINKKAKTLGIRIIIGIFIFFIPSILSALFSISDKININTSEYQACADCLFEPGKCNIDSN